MTLHGLGERLPLAHGLSSGGKGGAGARTHQSRRHLQSRHRRHAATQQHAGGAIQPRELIDVQLAANRRDAGDPGAYRCAHRRPAETVERAAEQREPAHCHRARMCIDELAPLQQQARGHGQVAADILVDGAEARHHVGHEEYHHQHAGDQQHGRIDAGIDERLAQRIGLLLIRDVARERLAQRAGPLARAHGCNV